MFIKKYFFLILFSSFSFSAPDIIDGEIVEKGKYEAVVKIYIMPSEKNGPVGLCSGTLLTKNTILTASHCLSRWDKEIKFNNVEVLVEKKTHNIRITSKYIDSVLVMKESMIGLDSQNQIMYNPMHDLGLILLKDNIKGLDNINFPELNFKRAHSLKDPANYQYGMNPATILMHELNTYKAVGFGMYNIVRDKKTLFYEYFNTKIGMYEPEFMKKRWCYLNLLPPNMEKEEYPLISIGTNYNDLANQARKKNYSEIFQGDSGGPLFNVKDEIVGVTTMTLPSASRKSFFYFREFVGVDSLNSIFVPLYNKKNQEFLSKFLK